MNIQIATHEDDSIVQALLHEYNKVNTCDFVVTNFELRDGVYFATVTSENCKREDALHLGIEYGLLIRKLRDEGKVS